MRQLWVMSRSELCQLSCEVVIDFERQDVWRTVHLQLDITQDVGET